MEHYDNIYYKVHEHIGSPLGNALSIEKEISSYLTHGIIAFVAIFIILQILSFVSKFTQGGR